MKLDMLKSDYERYRTKSKANRKYFVGVEVTEKDMREVKRIGDMFDAATCKKERHDVVRQIREQHYSEGVVAVMKYYDVDVEPYRLYERPLD